jgi:thiamine-monophosphate kinase
VALAWRANVPVAWDVTVCGSSRHPTRRQRGAHVRRDRMTVSDLGERRLVARIRTRFDASAGSPRGLVLGIGDDAAVFESPRHAHLVITTDSQVEGVHFDRRFSAPADVGHRALAVNLSDLAAMGARPRWALLSLVLSDTMPVSDLDEMVDGLATLAEAHGVTVIGGNLARSPGGMVVDITAIGEIHPRRLLTRAGGRPGDQLFVSGTIGGAAAGLAMLRARPDEGDAELDPALLRSDACLETYRRPRPRVRLGRAIADARAARAAIDLSDGLAEAVHQLADASGCGVDIDAEALPIDPGARDWWSSQGLDPIVASITGGDDYELLIAVPATWGGRLRHAIRRTPRPPLTRIGVLTKAPQSRVLRRGGHAETLPGGFDHFSAVARR